MVGVAHAMGQIRQARLNIWIELEFWVDGIIVSELDLGNPQHDAPALDILSGLIQGEWSRHSQSPGGRKFTFFKLQESPSFKIQKCGGLDDVKGLHKTLRQKLNPQNTC